VPARFTLALKRNGVFDRLHRERDPVYIDLAAQEAAAGLPRVAVAVRAGTEFLGSIWAAVREPLSEERTRALVDATKVVALHLLRLRAGADVERRLRTDLVSTALEGGAAAPEAVVRLGLLGRPTVVLAMLAGPRTGSGWPTRWPCILPPCSRGRRSRCWARSRTPSCRRTRRTAGSGRSASPRDSWPAWDNGSPR
jgi:hypothetical protein